MTSEFWFLIIIGLVIFNFLFSNILDYINHKNWKDKRTGDQRTKTTWVNCTIWKREGSNMRIIDFLTRGTLVEILGTPFAKTIQVEDGTSRTEIRLNVSKTNILRPANRDDQDATNFFDHEEEEDQYQTSIDDFSVDSDDFE